MTPRLHPIVSVTAETFTDIAQVLFEAVNKIAENILLLHYSNVILILWIVPLNCEL